MSPSRLLCVLARRAPRLTLKEGGVVFALDALSHVMTRDHGPLGTIHFLALSVT
jgi:hypothetical protein